MPNSNGADRRLVKVVIRGCHQEVPAGRSVLAACLEAGQDAPNVICGMGSCYTCVVSEDNGSQVRACITQVRDGASYDW